MSLEKKTVGLALLMLFSAPASYLFARPLPSDDRVLSGVLKNGVKWRYRQHDNPPGKMALMIHVDTGSLNETDAQRGLAHFIEHMCFNGTEHFAPGELIPYFESVGMEFGADLNAFTSFDQTAYMLFVPDTKTEELDKALMVLSDYAFRASLIKEEIEKERGVVLEESRAGKSAFQRIRDKLWPELFAGTRFAQRLPIGKDEILAHAQRDQFVDFYNTWYRPENVTVFLVGDTNAERMIPLIKKWFGKEKAHAPTRAAHGPEFKPFTRQRSIVVTDPEMAFCDVNMLNIRPGRPPTTTVEQWRTEMIETIGTWILNRRYEEMVNKGTASFRSANANVGSFFHDAVLASGTAQGEPGDWAKMLEQLVMEINRASQFGFTQNELDLAKKELLSDAERAVRTEPTANARQFLFQILSSINEEEPMQSAQQELDLYQELLPGARLSEVNNAFQEHFKKGTFAYVVEMAEKEGVDVPPRDEVLAAARAAWARTVTPPAKEETPTDLLASLPIPGKVVESTTDKDLGITNAWLSNGVRVHHRFMDYKKDTVLVSISLAGGQIEETADNVAITQVAALAVQEPATSRLTSTNIRDIMTGKNIRVRAGAGDDSFTLSINGSPRDLETGFQLAHALLTDGKIEESAFGNWKLRILQQLEMLDKMPRFKARFGMIDLLSGGDPRQKIPTKDDINRQSLPAAQAWFDRLCREAPIEVAVVGEIKKDEAMALVTKYIGSLPKRSRSAKHLDRLRRLARPTGPLERHIDVETMTPQAMALAGFAGCEGRNVPDWRMLSLAANIMDSRLVKRIREDLSIVYSIGATNIPSFVYKDAGLFFAGAPCDPKNAKRVADEVHTLFKAFAQDGPTDEELTNAKKQIANNLDTDMKEPRYWMSLLRNLDLHGRKLADEKGKVEDYNHYTARQVRDAFRKYYDPTRQFRVIALPTKVEKNKKEKAAVQG